MEAERQPQVLDIVIWERDGGKYTGLVWDIRGQVADILTGHGGALVYTEKLTVLLRREEWDPDALKNHLWAVYGIRLEDDEEYDSPMSALPDAARVKPSPFPLLDR